MASNKIYEWLKPVRDEKTKGFCKVCKKIFSIVDGPQKHANSENHLKAITSESEESKKMLFDSNWTQEYEWLKPVRDEKTKGFCKVCKKIFSIADGPQKHANSENHLKAITSESEKAIDDKLADSFDKKGDLSADNGEDSVKGHEERLQIVPVVTDTACALSQHEIETILIEPTSEINSETNQIKSSVGRPVNIDLSEIRRQFYEEHMDQLIINGKIAPLKSDVFEKLRKLCDTGNRNTEYLAVNRYMKRHNIIQSDHQSDSEGEVYTEFGHVSTGGETFTVDISGMMLFRDAESKMKEKSQFNNHLIQLIFKHTRKPCCWSLGHVFTQSSETKIHAVCLNENCNAKLIIYTQNQQSILQIIIYNYDSNVQHSKKRYLTGSDEKEKVEAILDLESAMVTRAKLANDYIFDENEYAAHLCSTDALRKRKQRMNEKSYRHDLSPIAVQIMKSEPQYKHTIGDIGLDPFYVFFGVPLQKEYLLSATCRKDIRLSLDSTGISIAPPQYSSISSNVSGRKYKKSFLYLISLQTGPVNVPIFQAISQRHSHEFIEYMLRYFQERFLNGKQPTQMIMDDSAALALACVRAYTPFKSMVEYNDACYEALFEENTPPPLQLQLDRSHYTKFIIDFNALRSIKEKGKRKFYQRILGYLMLCTDIKEAECVIENMFILLQNEYLYSERVITAKDELNSIAKSHKGILDENIPENYVQMHDIEEDRTLTSKTKSKFYKWVHRIAKMVDKNFVDHDLNNSLVETDVDRNPFVSSHLVKPLKRILSKIHLFSNVMNATFGSKNITPSSSCTEAQFRNIKSYIFNNKKGLRLDTWLERSIEITNGNFKALVADTNEASKLKKQTKTKKQTKVLKEAELHDPLNLEGDYRPLEEDWKRQNVDATGPIDKNHVPAKVSRSQNTILGIEKDGCAPIPLLMNGGKSKKIDDIPVIYSTQTCSFDSIFQLIASCYEDSPQFKEYVDTSDSYFAQFLSLFMSGDSKQADKTDAMRNNILIQLFPEKVEEVGDMKTIDCETVITDIFCRICKAFPVLNSIAILMDCCENHTVLPFLQFRLKNFSIKNVQASLIQSKSKIRCEMCMKLTTVQTFPQEIMAVDTIGEVRNERLIDIQSQIEFQGFQYQLLGVVEHKTKNKHFLAHALRSNNEWITYDDLNSRNQNESPTTIEGVSLILYRKVHTM